MTLRVALSHRTTYLFDRPVRLSPHLIRLRPAPHCRTPIEAYSLDISAKPQFLNWQQDPFGNQVARVVFPEPVTRLDVAVEVIAPMTVINPFDFFVERYAEHFPFDYPESLRKELGPYLEITERGERLLAWLREVPLERRGITDFLVALNQRLQQDIRYLVRMEPGVQKAEETLEKGCGSCRDSAWLLVQILRHLGLAARFVSGYLIQLAADVKAIDGPSGTEVDFTDLHAWTEVFVPGAGWIGLDPTSGLLAGEGHIPLAATPEPSSAAPIVGYSDECEVSFDFSMTLSRIHEDPRVTRPYSESQWQAIQQLGEQVDQRLIAGDVRLTMGGEPTFVAIDDMEAPEWNIAAQGPTKRRMAGALLKRLRAAFAPQGLLHYRQGKWYPGEPLPRWALACYWRRDGLPVWRDERWLADEGASPGYGPAQALQFAETLADHLDVSRTDLLPGYEDAFYHLWREQTLAVDVDPRAHDLQDDEERRRLARLLERGLGSVTGYALPLRYDERRHRWQSGPWPLRRDHLYLIPGDSPMGLRLPLSSLPQAAFRDVDHPHSLWAPDAALGDPADAVTRRFHAVRQMAGGERRDARAENAESLPYGSLAGGVHRAIADTEDGRDSSAVRAADDRTDQEEPPQGLPVDDEPVGTGLCVEAREGQLYVFVPPLTRLEHYLELIAAIESTAATLEMPVFVEGYSPPADARLEQFMITPDPGVIEVNIMPAKSWSALVAQTETLYEAARQTRLGAEKFMLDGRHTGTGGGNHVTLGGATPADSPFLRRPTLLASMVSYWQRHPALSYLFSGLFIGPTSQAPRVDEARHESLYELEIALDQLARERDEAAGATSGSEPPPWLVDRLFRHLLTDLTGNTHRAEFCIDKLYSPDSDTGRLGLLELRGFEMPPHARMSLMQGLLVRALVARFWERSDFGGLVRWGTALHDRWMLPHYLWSDLEEVLAELGDAGMPFEAAWFAPFLEFRCPVLGRVQYRGVELELRQAIEPWHVLGEEASGGGTSRYVDSSLERVQVKVSGMSGDRYVVTCNGHRVPLRRTDRNGEAVAGVRFRAWQPPSALHPRIPVHAPLTFDIVDTWNRRSIGGCTYHVAHPAGRNFETFPVNANEAEARRLARFWAHGHRQGSQETPEKSIGKDYPCTLDLRQWAGD
ncbi:transglutaminase family protein [Salinicola rhizosphaerae]|uniref:IMP dehydrogenase n=1 Tax=Salinicola rhizosphaerae TaxID=1443141 RepID=A0ABQ3DP11_9GAMM|nr:transglutaminase family protein [Salinicola rhizosphaerae]GHB08429.1 IMP dehydrogenase [Salinicola rhizosphaerae]